MMFRLLKKECMRIHEVRVSKDSFVIKVPEESFADFFTVASNRLASIRRLDEWVY